MMRYNNMNKYHPKDVEMDNEKEEEKKPQEVKLKSEMYNQDNEKLTKRDVENSTATLWGFVIGFILFIVLFILIIVFVK